MRSVADPERQLIVLLVGGPYDGQDIGLSKDEWAQGSLIRNGYRYASEVIAPGVGHYSGEVRIFTFVDSVR